MSKDSRFATAVHVMAALEFLHRQGMPVVPSSLLATSTQAQAPLIRRLLSRLKRARLVKAREGKRGGASLARPAAKISLWDIYSATEPAQFLGHAERGKFKRCPVSCSMQEIMAYIEADVGRSVRSSLKKKTVASLLKRVR